MRDMLRVVVLRVRSAEIYRYGRKQQVSILALIRVGSAVRVEHGCREVVRVFLENMTVSGSFDIEMMDLPFIDRYPSTRVSNPSPLSGF